jgi:hypothetical protein
MELEKDMAWEKAWGWKLELELAWELRSWTS